MNRNHARCGFTLIELLMVIGVTGCLVALLMPALAAARQKADSVACVANLRCIGMAGQLYAAEHDQVTPVIEPWPSEPVYAADDGVKTILDALKTYGVSAATLRCRCDIVGPNYNAREGSSYEWCPMANGQNVQAVKTVWAGNATGITLSRLLMAFDYSNVHQNSSNVLFGDCHVASGN
ncbi:MAG: prepilin-type N-terminal cleavage/methylation domain-containing protein [Chthoniobacter sp.]|nr:prepilin-type N-terminal cleavage/methylation domain-containing protein [Chthoniobacter sp.]